MSFHIRKAVITDLKLLIESQKAMAFESEGIQLDDEILKSGVEAVLIDPQKGTYWIAEEAGQLAGCLLCVPEWSDWRNSTVLWIHSVYTWPMHRKKGVYKALYLFLKERVQKSPKYAGIRLYVEKKNHIAQEVYSKLDMSADHYLLYEWLK